MDHDTMNVRRIIYSSASNIHPSEGRDGLADILRVARQRNHAAGISGALVLHKDRFAQIIEGPADQIKELFDKISQDERHTGIEIYEEKDVSEPVFSEWSMALVGVDPDADIQLFATKSALIQGAQLSFSDAEIAVVDSLRGLLVQ